MPLQIIRADITKLKVDAIVNAANRELLGGGGVDGAIHKAAGPKLLEACRKEKGCLPGEAKLTGGYQLPCRYVIHTVGPVWEGGTAGEAQILAACYQNALALAEAYHCESVAFPLISAGAYGYPREQALQIATEEIRKFLMEHEMTVILAVFDRESFVVSRHLLDEVREYIDDCYALRHGNFRRSVPVENAMAQPMAASVEWALPCQPKLQTDAALQQRLRQMDESFSQMLLRKIDERGMTDVQCYKRANVDRKLFSKIRSNQNYKTSKPTAIAFAIALELDLEETKELLEKAGYALSHSNPFDIIVEYFIQKGIHDIFRINEVLFAFDQSLLGV